ESPAGHRERLWPSPWLLIALLLLLPAVTMVVIPINDSVAVPTAVAVYLIITGTLTLMSPVIELSGGELRAGSARIPASALEEVERLGDAALRRVLGSEADARAYLDVRGYNHRGLRIEMVDAEEPKRFWLLTSRRPPPLAAAIEAAKAEAKA